LALITSDELPGIERADPEPTPVPPPTAKGPFGFVYSRVPRLHGDQEVVLRDGTPYMVNGTPYMVKSPDTYDMLSDTALRNDSFTAPGQLVWHKVSGEEVILYDCFAEALPCVPMDASVSFGGKKVLFAVYRGTEYKKAYRSGTHMVNKLLSGDTEAQLYMMDLETLQLTALPHVKGQTDTGPVWLPDGKIMFASDRGKVNRSVLRDMTPRTGYTNQLYIANVDGSNAKAITPHDTDGVLHPYVLTSGRVIYSAHQLNQNLAYGSTNSGLNHPGTIDNQWWLIGVDSEGGDMMSLLGAHGGKFKMGGRTHSLKAIHFSGERPNRDICTTVYYRRNNFGAGSVVCWPAEPLGVEGELPTFKPRGIYLLANWAVSGDDPSSKIDGIYTGKLRDPTGSLDGKVMVTFTRGRCTTVSGSPVSFDEKVADQPGRLACDAGIYQTTRIPSTHPDDLEKLVDSPDWHEFMPRIAEPYSKVYGIEKPAFAASKKTDNGSCMLASSDAGTAETTHNGGYSFNNYRMCGSQGCEMDAIPHEDMVGLRFWKVIPNPLLPRKKNALDASAGKKLELLGDVKLLADKSVAVELPCDTPYLMAGIDREGRSLNRDQVPQSLRPGEKRVCKGCHLHSREGNPFEGTMADKLINTPKLGGNEIPVMVAGAIANLGKRHVEFERDIMPLLNESCANCHSGATADAGLGLDVPGRDKGSTYDRLVWDFSQTYVPQEYKAMICPTCSERRQYGIHRDHTSKYVSSMFARESLLYWKAANKRLDGRTDDRYDNDVDFGPDHPHTLDAAGLRLLADWIEAGAYRKRDHE